MNKPKKALPPQFNLMARKEIKWTHPRDVEIDKLPVPISMAGIGNGGDSGMGRGR